MANSQWLECRLADACGSIDYGLTASATDIDTGPRFLRITDIVGGSIDWNSVPHVVADPAASAKYRLDDGDIVIARTGASTGASAYAELPAPIWPDRALERPHLISDPHTRHAVSRVEM
jgi:type I restriction enzyme, S subunit